MSWKLRIILFTAGLMAMPALSQEFENLKVMPEDIGKQELNAIMKGYAADLGVRCHFCHVGEPDAPLATYDFASDENKHKKVARTMIEMMQAIKGDFIEEEGAVTCWSCHRGVAHPRTVAQEMKRALSRGGAQRAKSRYAQIREEYYGKGAYDFGEKPLVDFAKQLAGDKDLDSAIAMLELNAEHHPRSAETHAVMGEIFAMKGDKAKALELLKQAAALAPGNEKLAERITELEKQ